MHWTLRYTLCSVFAPSVVVVNVAFRTGLPPSPIFSLLPASMYRSPLGLLLACFYLRFVLSFLEWLLGTVLGLF